MAAAARTVFCELGAQKSAVPVPRQSSAVPVPVPVPVPLPLPRQRSAVPSPDGGKILLQPRICTLRSYGSDERGAVMRTRKARDDVELTNFFASLVEYVESSRRSHDFEIISGRLAMVVFASAVSMELVTGNSLFQKMDLQQLAGAGGMCLAVIAFAATFARLSSARTKIGQIFTLQCNSFVDSLVDEIINSLFCEIEQSDWSDEV